MFVLLSKFNVDKLTKFYTIPQAKIQKDSCILRLSGHITLSLTFIRLGFWLEHQFRFQKFGELITMLVQQVRGGF